MLISDISVSFLFSLFFGIFQIFCSEHTLLLWLKGNKNKNIFWICRQQLKWENQLGHYWAKHSWTRLDIWVNSLLLQILLKGLVLIMTPKTFINVFCKIICPWFDLVLTIKENYHYQVAKKVRGILWWAQKQYLKKNLFK